MNSFFTCLVIFLYNTGQQEKYPDVLLADSGPACLHRVTIFVLNRYKCYMINLNIVSINVIYDFQWIS